MNNEDRVLPHDIEAEKVILSSMINNSDVCNRVLELGTLEMFYHSGHQIIFKLIGEMVFDGIGPDLVSLADYMDKRGVLDRCGGTPYLAEISGDSASVTSIEHYISILQEKFVRRSLIASSQEISRDAFNPEIPVSTLIASSETALFTATEAKKTNRMLTMSEVLSGTFAQIEAAQNSPGGLGIKTGLTRLDAKTGGLMDTDLIVIAGRPSMGKTSLALSMVLSAGKQKKKVGIFSLEMGNTQLGMRTLALESRLDILKMRTGTISKRDMPKISIAAGPIAEMDIYIDDNPSITIQEIRAKTIRHKFDIIFMDYLQLMDGPFLEDRQNVGFNSKNSKKIAKSLDISVVLLSQLSRANEAGAQVREPRLSDLRESGQIEQDADVVLFVHREEFYKKTPENEGLAKIIIGKQRNGPAGEYVSVAFLKECALFANLTDIHQEEAEF